MQLLLFLWQLLLRTLCSGDRAFPVPELVPGRMLWPWLPSLLVGLQQEREV